MKQQIESSAVTTLLSICRASLISKTNKPITNISEKLVQLAMHHRISRVVGHELMKNKEAKTSTTVNQLKSYNKKRALKMLSFSSELSKIGAEFTSQAIPYIPLKGPVVAFQVFGDLTAKNSRDLDFLIQEEQLDQTIEVLSKNGYTLTLPYDQYSPKQKSYFRKANNQLTLFNQQKKIPLEIHWRLFANPLLLPLSLNELLKSSTKMMIGNVAVPALSSEHLLFYLTVHGAKHQWALLYWLHELATLIQKESFEWNSILAKATKLSIERPLVQGVMLIESLFKIEAPKEIKTYHQSHPTIQDLVDMATATIKAEQTNLHKKSISNYWGILGYKWKLRKGWKYKLAYIQGISIKDFELIKLPDTLFFCYFWLRPFFWFWRYIISPQNKNG